MIYFNTVKIHHPTDTGRWVEVEYSMDVDKWDFETNSANAKLYSYAIIEQSYKDDQPKDEWDDTEWVTWELVRKSAKL